MNNEADVTGPPLLSEQIRFREILGSGGGGLF